MVTLLKNHMLHKVMSGRKNQQAEHKWQPTSHNIRMQKEYYLNKEKGISCNAE